MATERRWHPHIYSLPEAAPEVWTQLDDARRLLDRFARGLERVTAVDVLAGSASLAESLTPFRCIVLAYIGRAKVYGISPSVLARSLGTPRPLLDYHLDVLEKHHLIHRYLRGLYDGRRVSIVLTWSGGEALTLASRVLANVTKKESAPTNDEATTNDEAPTGADPADLASR